MIYNPGLLNKRIKIYEPADTTNSGGFDSTTPKLLATVWGQVAPLRGREYYEHDKTRDENLVKIVIRYRKDLQECYTVEAGGHTYNINSIVNPGADCESLELYCTESIRGKQPQASTGGGGWEP